MIYKLVLRNFDCSLEFIFSLLLLQPFSFSPVSFACNFQDRGYVILREINFLSKIFWSIPCLHPAWKVHTWIEICASLNHRKKTKADGSRLIPRKHTETLVLLSFTGSVEHTGQEKFPRKATCVSAFFSENPRKQPDAKELSQCGPVQLQSRRSHVARHSVVTGSRNHSKKNFKFEICWKPYEVTFVSLNCLRGIKSVCTRTMNSTFSVYHYCSFYLFNLRSN